MKKEILPGHEEQPDDITCASCGRFVGALSKCPHCGAKVNKRLSVRATRYAAVLLAVIGLALLYWMSVTAPIQTIKIGDIKPTMNFAFIRVEGTVSSDARIFQKNGRTASLSFSVDDGTGDLSIRAYRDQAKEMVEQNIIPRIGDKIAVAGGLSVSSDKVFLRVQTPKQIQLSSAELPHISLGQLKDGITESGVTIEGVIDKVYAPSSAPGKKTKSPWKLTISDGTGFGNVTFWSSTYTQIRDKDKLVPGQAVRIRASVGSYKGKQQLNLNNGNDIEFIDSPASAPAVAPDLTDQVQAPVYREIESLTIEEITPDLKGQKVETEGQIVGFYEPKEGTKAPYSIMLEDGTSRVRVIYWDDVAEELGDRKPEKGTRMQVRGLVDQFKKKMQIKVKYAGQMEFYQIPPIEAVVIPEIIPIGDIDETFKGQTQTVSGKLGKSKSIRSGVLYPLRDKSGKIQLLLWDKNIPGEARDDLQPGKKVRVTGTIGIYKGTLQIVPVNPESIHLY